MQRVEFLGGATTAAAMKKFETNGLPKVAFAGRSNVGKSSLLNTLTHSKIARVSATPGKTREMNLFHWNLTKHPAGECVLVDLPGYGYAKVPMDLRKQWGAEITQWVKTDADLKLVVALVDGRHGYLDNDVELVRFLIDEQVPFLVAFTKMDKWKSNNQRKSAERELAGVSKKLGVEGFVFVSTLLKAGIVPLEKALREAFGIP